MSQKRPTDNRGEPSSATPHSIPFKPVMPTLAKPPSIMSVFNGMIYNVRRAVRLKPTESPRKPQLSLKYEGDVLASISIDNKPVPFHGLKREIVIALANARLTTDTGYMSYSDLLLAIQPDPPKGRIWDSAMHCIRSRMGDLTNLDRGIPGLIEVNTSESPNRYRLAQRPTIVP